MVKFLVSWIWLLSILSVGEMVKGLEPCYFPAIYNFGDSNSDTGGRSAAFQPVPPPNGQSFFGRPAGRGCDGRLVIDFIAEKLNVPYLNAYLDSIGTNFRHGANFATAGSSIRMQNVTALENGFNPFPLYVQIWQFNQFKARTTELYNQAKDPSERAYLPSPDEFSKAIYTFDIGQNDIAVGFQKMTAEQLQASIPSILDQFALAIQDVYQQGGRSFWIHNTGPIGCLPLARMFFSGDSSLLDQHGCIKYQNDIAVEFNKQLKERVIQWREQFQDAVLTYVDMYAAKYQLISDSKNQGFVDPFMICCGHDQEGHHVWCGQKETINGTEIYGGSCANPDKHISWDGVHYTHAANQWLSNHILYGALSDPSISITQACRNHP